MMRIAAVRERAGSRAVLAASTLLLACAPTTTQLKAAPQSPQPGALSLTEWVQAITAADYAGDRAGLDRLYEQADAFLGDPGSESRVRYWKGFAKWRRTLNGANEDPPPTDLVADLALAVAELRRAGELDPRFVDARIGEMQCLGLMLFFDRSRVGDTALVNRLRSVMEDLRQTASDHPRYVWVWGMAYFGAPPEKGGGPDKVIEAYHRALAAIRAGAQTPRTVLDPTWGEAELHVNLAYAYLNKPSPELRLAKQHVDRAISLVPTWHYARDILRVQIETALMKAR